MSRRLLAVTPLDDRVLPAAGVLFFGNSHTDSGPHTRIDQLVREVMAAAGQEPAVTGIRAPGGETLGGHEAAVDPAAVRALMPAGQAADIVVLQGQSLEAASVVSGPYAVGFFTSAARALAADVRAAFPAAKFVLYETPARPGTNPDFYPPYYPEPAAMQADIRAGYDAAAGDLRTLYGAAAAEVAPAGGAFGELAHAAGLYADAGGHPSARGAVAVALTVYAAAFDDNVSDIPADRAAALLADRGLTAADWTALTRAADRAVGRANAAQLERFVRQVYRDVLGREADAGGLSAFLGGLADGTLSRQQVAAAVINSPENQAREVRAQYRQYLGRAADPGGADAFTAQLRSGRGHDWVRAALIGSDEYLARAGGTPDGFVRAAYRDVLGRDAETAGLAYWSGRLAAGASRFDVASGIVNSRESRLRQVRAAYLMFLRREADAGGASHFATLLQAGLRFEDFTVAVAVVGSGEYLARLA